MKVHVTIEKTPAQALSPNSRKGFMAYHRERGPARAAAKKAVEELLTEPEKARLREAEGLMLRWTIYWEKGRKTWDQTNLIAALKAFEDGIADGLGLNDKIFIVQPPVQERDPAHVGRTVVALSAVTVQEVP